MFNDIGPLELVTLVVLAVLVFGPDKLPKIIQDVTRTIRKIREFSDSAKAGHPPANWARSSRTSSSRTSTPRRSSASSWTATSWG